MISTGKYLIVYVVGEMRRKLTQLCEWSPMSVIASARLVECAIAVSYAKREQTTMSMVHQPILKSVTISGT